MILTDSGGKNMNCPSCHTVLNLADRNGVEIDYCPQCRGVWLDRGELDKLIERSNMLDSRNGRDSQEYPRAPYQPYQGQPGDREIHNPDRQRKVDDDYRYDGRYDSKRNRRKSFLGDLFDFD
jgi:Zn-finger nucleic acid-binding protein